MKDLFFVLAEKMYFNIQGNYLHITDKHVSCFCFTHNIHYNLISLLTVALLKWMSDSTTTTLYSLKEYLAYQRVNYTFHFQDIFVHLQCTAHVRISDFHHHQQCFNMQQALDMIYIHIYRQNMYMNFICINFLNSKPH